MRESAQRLNDKQSVRNIRRGDKIHGQPLEIVSQDQLFTPCICEPSYDTGLEMVYPIGNVAIRIYAQDLADECTVPSVIIIDMLVERSTNTSELHEGGRIQKRCNVRERLGWKGEQTRRAVLLVAMLLMIVKVGLRVLATTILVLV